MLLFNKHCTDTKRDDFWTDVRFNWFDLLFNCCKFAIDWFCENTERPLILMSDLIPYICNRSVRLDWITRFVLNAHKRLAMIRSGFGLLNIHFLIENESFLYFVAIIKCIIGKWIRTWRFGEFLISDDIIGKALSANAIFSIVPR